MVFQTKLTNMKMKIFGKLLFLSLIFSAFSCKKNSASSDTNGDSYVKFKLNGTWVTHVGLGELGPDLGDATKTDLGVTGNSADGKQIFDITIQLDGTNFPTGTYSSDAYPSYYMVVSLMLNPTPSTLKHYDISDVSGKPSSKYTVNISSITPTEIRGTFTGNYLYSSFNSDDADGGIVQITEGEFKVKRIR